MRIRTALITVVRLVCLASILLLAFALGRWLREPSVDGGIVLLLGILASGYVIHRLVGRGGVAAFTSSRPERAEPAADADAPAPTAAAGTAGPSRSSPAGRARERARREAERAREAVAPRRDQVGAAQRDESTLEPLTADVNSATVEELAGVRGIGSVAAQRIVAEREANGPFASLDDLTRVEGFVSSRIARLRAQGVDAR